MSHLATARWTTALVLVAAAPIGAQLAGAAGVGASLQRQGGDLWQSITRLEPAARINNQWLQLGGTASFVSGDRQMRLENGQLDLIAETPSWNRFRLSTSAQIERHDALFGFARGGGGFNSFAAHGGVRNSFASTNSGVMRNATVNRSFSNTARMSQNMQYHHWNNGNSGWHHHGRRHAFFAPGLAFGYGYYGGYYDDYRYDSAYYDDGYYGDDYAYNDYDGCYRIQRYHTRSGWHTRTVNVCQ